MTTYKEIKGTQIQVLSSDPTNLVDGQVWYNSTDQAVKAAVFSADTVTSGGNYPETLYQAGSAGVQTAALGYGGRPNNNRTTGSYSYNGSNWTSTPSLNSARSVFQSSFGTSTSAIAVNGQGPPSSPPVFVDFVEEFNGSSWSEKNSTNETRRIMSGIGDTGTSGLVAGGYTAPGATSVNVEQWNGTNWTEVNNLNNPGGYKGGAGDVTAGLAFGNAAKVESWNGTNWTELTDAPATLQIGGGTTTAVIAAGGPATQNILKYDGSSWTTSPASFSVGHGDGGYAGNPGTAAVVFAGAPSPSYTNSTEEFDVAAFTTRTFTDS